MSPYIAIVIWIAVCAVVICGFGKAQYYETVNGKQEVRVSPLIAFLIVVPMILWAGSRQNFGDTEVYRDSFLQLPSSMSGMLSYIKTINKDKGFTVLSIIIKTFIGNKDIWFLTLIALLQGSCLVYVYRKYSSNYVLSMFLFIISTDYMSWMFNGMRQFIAVTILFAAIGLILKKKYVPLICLILLISTIHGSALLMLPIVFIAQGEAWNKKTVFLLGISVVTVLAVDQFSNLLSSVLANSQYDDIMTNEIWLNDDGTSALRVMVYSVPMLIAFLGRKQIRIINDPIINLCTNMSIASTAIYLISMFTSGIYIGRIPIYFSLFNYILLPWEVENLFTKRSKPCIYLMIILLYIIFYYYQLHKIWGVI